MVSLNKKKMTRAKRELLKQEEGTETHVLVGMQKDIMMMSQQAAIYSSEVKKNMVENEWLHEQLKQMRHDNQIYLQFSRKRLEGMLLELAELSRRVKEKDEKEEKAIKSILAKVQEKKWKMHFELTEARKYADKVASDLEYSKMMIIEDYNAVKILQVELEECKENNEQAYRGLKNEFVGRHYDVNIILQRELQLVTDNIEKHLRRQLIKGLGRVHDANMQAQDNLRTTLQRKAVLEAKRNKLAQAKEALQKDLDYWVDMNSKRKVLRNHKTARPHSVSVQQVPREEATPTTSDMLKPSVSQASRESGMNGSEHCQQARD